MGSEGWLGFLLLYDPFLVDSSQVPSSGAALGGYMVFGPWCPAKMPGAGLLLLLHAGGSLLPYGVGR